jgi:hypothetical protein
LKRSSPGPEWSATGEQVSLRIRIEEVENYFEGLGARLAKGKRDRFGIEKCFRCARSYEIGEKKT